MKKKRKAKNRAELRILKSKTYIHVTNVFFAHYALRRQVFKSLSEMHQQVSDCESEHKHFSPNR